MMHNGLFLELDLLHLLAVFIRNLQYGSNRLVMIRPRLLQLISQLHLSSLLIMFLPLLSHLKLQADCTHLELVHQI